MSFHQLVIVGQVIDRILSGDFIFTFAGALAICAALIVTSWVRRPTWLKVVMFLVLGVGFVVAGHYLVEAAQAKWTAPLGEPMHIITR